MFRLEMPRSHPVSRETGATYPAPGRSGPTRRDFLQAGTLCGLGLSLPGYLRLRAQGRARPGRAGHGILLLLTGAPGHLDTWDPKPDAPPEIRGPFRPIRTSIPGVWISEIFPQTARRVDRFAILRSVHRPAAEAPVPGHLHPLPADRAMDPPIATVAVPQGTRLQEAIDHAVRALERSPAVTRGDAALQEACARLTAPQARAAFDLSQEPDAVRDRYGRNRFGQSCLLARRLIESGVPFVTVRMFDPAHPGITWDAHGAPPFPSLEVYRTHCGPWFDAGYTALLEDLTARGLYESTVVCAMGEFGRTPRLNAAGGRDHWPHCWSLLIGGGGIRGGQVVGASDAIGGYPQDRPIPLPDVVATLYAALGISGLDPAARPVPELF